MCIHFLYKTNIYDDIDKDIPIPSDAIHNQTRKEDVDLSDYKCKFKINNKKLYKKYIENLNINNIVDLNLDLNIDLEKCCNNSDYKEIEELMKNISIKENKNKQKRHMYAWPNDLY